MGGGSEFCIAGAIDGEPRSITVRFEGMQVDLWNNYPTELLSDYLNYTYYQVVNIYGSVQSAKLSIDVTGLGHFETERATFSFASLDGDIYFDFTGIDLSLFGVEGNKYVIRDAYRFVEDYALYGDLLDAVSLPKLSIEPLVNAVKDEEAVSIADAAQGKKQLSIELGSKILLSLAKSIGYKGADQDFIDLVEDIIDFDADSALRFVYDPDTYEPSAVHFNLGYGPHFDSISIGNLTVDTIHQRYDNLHIVSEAVEDFELDPADYQDYQPIE